MTFKLKIENGKWKIIAQPIVGDGVLDVPHSTTDLRATTEIPAPTRNDTQVVPYGVNSM